MANRFVVIGCAYLFSIFVREISHRCVYVSMSDVCMNVRGPSPTICVHTILCSFCRLKMHVLLLLLPNQNQTKSNRSKWKRSRSLYVCVCTLRCVYIIYIARATNVWVVLLPLRCRPFGAWSSGSLFWMILHSLNSTFFGSTHTPVQAHIYTITRTTLHCRTNSSTLCKYNDSQSP